jgi:PAS domain S-box-containing protein
VKTTIAEFLLRHASDAAELAQRAEVLAALTQLPPQRRNELAEAVNMVCRTIAAHGGCGKVRFSLVQRGGDRFIEVSVSEPQSADSTSTQVRPPAEAVSKSKETEAAVIQRVGEMVDHFESSGWPVSGAVIRMAQALSPAFSLPTEAEVTEWAKMLKANNALDALAFALRRARSLEIALGQARCHDDLRSRLAAETSDAENLNALSLVISKTKNAISIMARDGTIIGVNDAFVRLTGFEPSEALGKRQDELLFGPSTDPEAVREYRESLNVGRELTRDVMQYRKDGRTFWVEIDLIPVPGADGSVARWIAICNDVTKRRQTEDALRAAKDTAESHSRMKSEFLANLSHEIRTPMNAIIGMTELALSTDLSAEQRSYLQTVRSSGESLLTLLNDILDLSKIEAGKMELENIDFDLTEVISETLRGLEVEAQEKKLPITLEMRGDLPRMVRGDPTKLRQILVNLVGNSIKFTEQGRITVEVEEQWRNEEEVGLHVSVKDTGIGIPAEQLDKVFQAFTQGDASTTRKFGGSGLGLTITSELVRMMNGRIWVHSTPGQGSNFHFTIGLKLSKASATAASVPEPVRLPAVTKETAPREEKLPAGKAERSLNVLVADDHDANRNLVVTVLRKRGHRCVEAVNGNEVLDAVRREHFDVVLMDVQMPQMDGFQATAEIRKREETTGGHLPIIALTAHAMTGDREKCLVAGMDAYLAKPLRPKKLVNMVESVFDLDQQAAKRASPVENDARPDSDFDFTAALDSLDNDEDLLISQMNFFLTDGPVLAGQIDQAIDEQDPHQVQISAHRLKGMLSRYDYHRAAALAHELERKGEQHALAGAKPVCHQLTQMVNRLVAAIQQYVDDHSRP